MLSDAGTYVPNENDNMTIGKNICTQLKNIRLAIAKANDIAYTPTLCTYEGECMGTCPTCDAELKFLTDKIEEKKRKGELIHIKNVGENLVQKLTMSNDEISSFLSYAKSIENYQKLSMENQNKRLETYNQMLETLYSAREKASYKEKKTIEEDIATIKEIISNLKQ